MVILYGSLFKMQYLEFGHNVYGPVGGEILACLEKVGGKW